MRSSFARFIDNLVIAIIFVMVGFLLFKQFIKNSIVCLALSTLLAFAFITLIVAKQNRKLSKYSIEKSELKNIELYNFELRKLSLSNQLNFFSNVFCHHKLKRGKNFLIVDDETLLYLCLEQDILPSSSLYKANLLGYKKIIILCNKTSAEIEKLIPNFDSNIIIYTPLETYALMKAHNCFLPITQLSRQKKTHRLSQAFMKKRAKDFIRIGILLYLMALFVPFTKYYLVAASISLILGAICLLFGKSDVKIKKVLPYINQ